MPSKFEFSGAGRKPDDFQLKVREQVFKKLKRNKLSTAELAESLELPISDVRRGLRFLEKNQFVVKAGTKKLDTPGQPSIIWESLES